MKALQQLLHQVEWGHLDLLVIDMPPGTGDVQLTISQQVELDGIVYIISVDRAIDSLFCIRCCHYLYSTGHCID